MKIFQILTPEENKFSAKDIFGIFENNDFKHNFRILILGYASLKAEVNKSMKPSNFYGSSLGQKCVLFYGGLYYY